MNLYYKIKNKLIYDHDCLRARWQRFKRGYSYGDVWGMFDWFLRTVKPMLVHLREHHCGVPIEFENDPSTWEFVLTEMIDCLTLMDEDNAYAHHGFGDWDARREMTKEDYKKVYRTMEDNKNRFFELFSKYFYNLWD